MPDSSAGRRSPPTGRATLNRLARRLPIPMALLLGAGMTLAWVAFLCWAAFSAVTEIVGN